MGMLSYLAVPLSLATWELQASLPAAISFRHVSETFPENLEKTPFNQ